MSLGLRLTVLLSVLLWFTPAAAGSGWTWKPLASSARLAKGVWRSQGYGRILKLDEGGTTLFHTAGPYCYPDAGASLTSDDSFRLMAERGPNRIATAAAPDQTRYLYDRIPALPAACAQAKTWSRADVAAVVAATFTQLYPGFGHRGRDSRSLTRALTAGAAPATDLELYERLSRALGGLDDAHVGLEARFDGEDHAFEGGESATLKGVGADRALGGDAAARVKAWARSYREGMASLLTGGGRQVANRRILWGRIGQVGYLNVVTMGAFEADAAADDTSALNATLNEAIAAFEGLPGVIVDVTYNAGGYDSVGLAIAGRFADRPRLAFTKQAMGASGPPQRFYVRPAAGARYLGPVTLLTSDITVSAGETFALAMRALPNVKHVGARTRGALSDQLTKPLPGGWTLTLPAELYRDAGGRAYEGVGIDPTTVRSPSSPDHRSLVADLAADMQSPRR